MGDISITENNKKFNFRVGAFIFDSSQKYVLLHKKINNDFWMLPGGRVEFGEDTDSAIKREMKEELDIDVEPKCALIIENLYTYNNISVHELDFDYVVTLNHKIEDEKEFTGIEGEYLIFKWVNKNNIEDYNMCLDEEKRFIKNYENEEKGILKLMNKKKV